MKTYYFQFDGLSSTTACNGLRELTMLGEK